MTCEFKESKCNNCIMVDRESYCTKRKRFIRENKQSSIIETNTITLMKHTYTKWLEGLEERMFNIEESIRHLEHDNDRIINENIELKDRVDSHKNNILIMGSNIEDINDKLGLNDDKVIYCSVCNHIVYPHDKSIIDGEGLVHEACKDKCLQELPITELICNKTILAQLMKEIECNDRYRAEVLNKEIDIDFISKAFCSIMDMYVKHYPEKGNSWEMCELDFLLELMQKTYNSAIVVTNLHGFVYPDNLRSVKKEIVDMLLVGIFVLSRVDMYLSKFS